MKFCRQHECRAVRPEVCEEEGQSVEQDEELVVVVLEVLVVDAEDEHEHRHHEESDELDQVPADRLDEQDGEPVAGEGAEEGDDEHGPRGLEDFAEGANLHGGTREVDRGEDVLLG